MREYSKVAPGFWTGETGRYLRTQGPRTQVVAFYLFTGPSANMLGLYYLALPTLCHESGSPLKEALKALRSLSEGGFAHYNTHFEHVFVPNMAREQLGPRLKRKDNRHVAVVRELEQLKKSPFFPHFMALYREAYELSDLDFAKPLQRPLQGPSKPLRSQEQEQEQEQEQKQEQEKDSSHANGNGSLHVVDEGTSTSPVEQVFEHWKSTWGKPKAKLDAKRSKVIRTALKVYPPETLCEAIAGYRKSEFHLGKNDRHTAYDDIEIFLKDAKHIEAGLKFAASEAVRRWD